MYIEIDFMSFKDYTDEQIRAIITTICIAEGIEVDTGKWDNLIYDIFTHYYCGSIKTLEEFDMYMCRLLV